jgi:DNA-binding protein H-NS
MAKRSLTSMSVEALLTLRDDIGKVLTTKAETLRRQLAALGQDYKEFGRIAIYGKKSRGSLAGRKVAPKYRDPKSSVTWAGRGAQPVWLRDALKSGKKLDSFLIDKPAKSTAGKKVGKKKQGRPTKRKVRRTKSASRKTTGAAASAPVAT